jgi:hypothetical protein
MLHNPPPPPISQGTLAELLVLVLMLRASKMLLSAVAGKLLERPSAESGEGPTGSAQFAQRTFEYNRMGQCGMKNRVHPAAESRGIMCFPILFSVSTEHPNCWLISAST